jgi:hypothetical protein
MPIFHKNLVTEFFKISKRCNTSYIDCYKMSPVERGIILDILENEDNFIREQVKENQKKK